MTHTTERTILLSFLHSNCKGVGFIAVDNIPLTEKILLDFISEDSFQDDYINCPSGNFLQIQKKMLFLIILYLIKNLTISMNTTILLKSLKELKITISELRSLITILLLFFMILLSN